MLIRLVLEVTGVNKVHVKIPGVDEAHRSVHIYTKPMEVVPDVNKTNKQSSDCVRNTHRSG